MTTWLSPTGAEAAAEFDSHAARYEQELQQGLRFSGETSAFFAEGRVRQLRAELGKLRHQPRVALDFGCGTGQSVPLLLSIDGVERAIGVDVSPRLLEQARTSVVSSRVCFQSLEDDLEDVVDLAFCNGVFHHIAPSMRPAAVDYVVRALRPNGVFAFCENNPYNPGTRVVMRNIAFDRDAQTLTPRSARAVLQGGGLEIIGIAFMFFFPRPLRALRWMEHGLTRVPLGAQYMVLARKPG